MRDLHSPRRTLDELRQDARSPHNPQSLASVPDPALLSPRHPNLPHQRSPPGAFPPRNDLAVRPLLAPMARAPRIETASRRAKDLPRDPTYWVDQDLLSFVSLHYPPIEASPLSSVIEKHKLTPQALWYLQDSHEHLSTIAKDESLKETLLKLAESVQPAVSPTTPRVRHVRRLSEDLLRPPPPSPPPAVPSPPPPEEPVLEDDDDVAESIVSDWAFDEDRDVDDNSAPAAGESSAPADTAPVPGSPVQGLGLHTGEERSDVPETAQPPQPESTGGVDLMTFEDDSQQEMTPLQATSQPPAAAPVNADADHAPAADPPLEEMISAQGASAGTHVPSATEEEPSSTTATRSADQLAPSDEPLATPRASQDAPAGEPADPGPSTQTSPVEDEDHRRFSERDSTPTADPPRTASPSSDYHDANSTHDEEGEQQQAPAAHAAPEESSSEPAQQAEGHEAEGHKPSAVDQQSARETDASVSTSEDKHDEVSATPDEDAWGLSEEVSGLSEDTSKSGEDVSKLDEGASKDGGDEPQVTETTPAEEPVQQPSLSPSSVEPASQLSPEETVPESGAQSSATQEDEIAQQVASGDAEEAQQPQVPLPEPTLPDPLSSEQSSETVALSEQSDETVKAEKSVIDDVRAVTSVENVGEDKDAKVEATETNATETETPPPAAALEQTDEPAVVADDPQLRSTEQDVDGISNGVSHEAVTTEAKPAQGPDQTDDAPQVPGNSTRSTSTPSEPPATDTPASTTSADKATATMPATPSSPTVKLASGREMQLVSLDSESREQTPAASASGTPAGLSPSPSGTPSGASPIPSSSRQTSPPASMIPEGKDTSTSSPSVPMAKAAEKSLRLPQLDTTLGPLADSVRPAGPSANHHANPWQHSPAGGQASSSSFTRSPVGGRAPPYSPAPQAKSPAWGSARTWVTSLTSSLGLGSQSEPTTRNPSQEREQPPPPPRTSLTPAPAHTRQEQGAGRGAGRGAWAPGTKKSWSATVSASTISQQNTTPPREQSQKTPAPPLASPSGPSPAPEPSGGSSQVPDKTAASETSDTTSPKTKALEAAGEAVELQKTESGLEQEDVSTDSVLVDADTPSAVNGGSSRIGDAEVASGQPKPPTQASMPCRNEAGGQDSTQGAVSGSDEDLVEITLDDAACALEVVTGTTQKPEDDDDEDNLPLNKAVERLRQPTGGSVSSTLTSDTETQADEDQMSSSTDRRNRPEIRIPGLTTKSQGVNSPIADSPVVGSPSPSDSAATRKQRKKARQNAKRKAESGGT
ncbi:hypothetical protein DICSQDRAFT_178338 [Dichomitus squalens LYAD-421 SS1]|uniref:uncharacterized protein n=1 Tax=Dichomitus squalens (strain LYAD-421) TaxID=732165 RepID=UPI00044146FA|nr:uncharacterized protein DICSQDRAFT_178338 [Dichomitus squalens LYAD-421 SS1]EJF64739.1 hypothetical protein DICSQDRAFT_178338 [Dichomitus squalens LYAD-421 SS1]